MTLRLLLRPVQLSVKRVVELKAIALLRERGGYVEDLLPTGVPDHAPCQVYSMLFTEDVRGTRHLERPRELSCPCEGRKLDTGDS